MPKADFTPRRRRSAVVDFLLLGSTIVFMVEAALVTVAIVNGYR